MATKKPTLGIHRLDPQIPLPKKATKGSACVDIEYNPHGKRDITIRTPISNELKRPLVAGTGDCFIMPMERAMIPTGLKLDIPEGYSARLHIRSSSAYVHGLAMVNGEGIIDSDYTDELFILVQNVSERKVTINPGARVAQLELVENLDFEIEESKTAPAQKTERVGGIGSTG